MIRLNEINETLIKCWEKKVVAFILAKRFCFKHMREFIEKNIAKKDYKKFDVAQLLGICSRCKKAGIVYYLEEK